MTYREMKAMVLDDPSRSTWLKEALWTLESRNLVDVLTDVRTLEIILASKLRDMQT